jgi:hypothetical protein
MMNADPKQAIAMVKEFNKNPGIIREHVVMLVRSAVQCAAEVCASYQPILGHGEQSITTEQLVSFLNANTTPITGKKQEEGRNKVYKKMNETMHTVQTGINNTENPYEGDELWQYVGQSIIAVDKGGEKMNMAGDFPRIHVDERLKTWKALNSDRVSLLSEKTRLEREAGETYISLLTQHARQQRVAGEAPNAALTTVNKKLADIEKQMMDIEQRSFRVAKDCEDSSYTHLCSFDTLENNADFLYEEVKLFVTKGFLPMESMFPSGKVDTVFKTDNEKTEAIHFIVKASLQLMSDSLKWQSKPVNGTRYSYESCFGLASAPSLKVQENTEPDKQTLVTREQCTSYLNLLERLFGGNQTPLAGHCYTVRSKNTVVKEFKNGVKIELHEIGPEDMLEGTVANAMFRSKENMDKNIGIKNVDISIAGRNVFLQGVSHSQARDVIGAVVMNKIKSGDVGKQVSAITPLNMEKGINFYDIFSQIGGKQAFSAEITNSNNITSMMDHVTTANALMSRTPNVSFCTSAIAWGGCPQKLKKTQAVSIDVPLDPEEHRRIKQIAYELAPMHEMTKEHLAFMMNDMERVVNVGFENGKFYGNDITGERLDSETRISHFFVLSLNDCGRGEQKYWSDRKGINAVLQREMQAALPGLAVRVSQLETGLHVMQVVVNS